MSSLGPAGPGGDPAGVDALCLFASASDWPGGGREAQFFGVPSSQATLFHSKPRGRAKCPVVVTPRVS